MARLMPRRRWLGMFARDNLFPGVPLALGSAALFGATLPATKLLVAWVSPLLLAAILYLGAGLGLALFKLGRSHTKENAEAPLNMTDAKWLAGAVICGGIIAPVLLVYGLAVTDASTAALLLNLEGLATMAIAWVVLRENVDSRLLLGAASILFGAILLTWDGKGLTIDTGALLIAAACVAWGIDNNLDAKRLRSRPDDRRYGQGAGRRGRQPCHRRVERCSNPFSVSCGCGSGRRLYRYRGEPGVVRQGASFPGRRQDRCLLLTGSLHRCGVGRAAPRRTRNPSAALRGGVHGAWAVPPPYRAAQP